MKTLKVKIIILVKKVKQVKKANLVLIRVVLLMIEVAKKKKVKIRKEILIKQVVEKVI